GPAGPRDAITAWAPGRRPSREPGSAPPPAPATAASGTPRRPGRRALVERHVERAVSHRPTRYLFRVRAPMNARCFNSPLVEGGNGVDAERRDLGRPCRASSARIAQLSVVQGRRLAPNVSPRVHYHSGPFFLPGPTAPAFCDNDGDHRHRAPQVAVAGL